MKVFIISALLAALVVAEPPANRQQYYFAKQQDLASAPYEPSGWKPDGPAFNTPQKQEAGNFNGPSKQQYRPQAASQQQYGPPAAPEQQYAPPAAAPQQQYGAPAAAAPQQQYGAPAAAPQQQYGAPAAPPEQQFGAPSAPQRFGPSPQRFGTSQQQFGSQQRFGSSQQQFGAYQQQFGTPQKQGEGFQQFRGASAPQTQYGAPQNPEQQFATPRNPQQQYGPPEFTTTEFPDTAGSDEPTTVKGLNEAESEPVNSVNELGDEGEVDEQQQQPQQQQPQQQQKSGQYFVALPDGRLQRVRYASREDIEAMKYFARIRAENVEPLRGPIYAYSPLQPLQVSPASLQVAVAAPVPADTSRPEKLRVPKVDIQPITQIQYQLDSPGNANVVPLNSAYTSYADNYQAPSANNGQRFIVSLP